MCVCVCVRVPGRVCVDPHSGLYCVRVSSLWLEKKNKRLSFAFYITLNTSTYVSMYIPTYKSCRKELYSYNIFGAYI